MSTVSSPSSSPPPTRSRRKLKTCARRCERGCCTVATYFPLAFVYSLTSWAVWVEANIGFGDNGAKTHVRSVKASSIIGVCLYTLLNVSYTTAVFTDPGSPKNASKHKASGRGKYSAVPDADPESNGALPTDYTAVTVSGRGGARFCKKCQHPKPDRTHHCSTCRRCVLKMDHHCPWLATCLGLHNYKAFLLFLIYTTFFSWVCLGSSSYWMWTELLADNRYLEEYAPINIIMLSVIAGVIGLVLAGFTGWHTYLVLRGQTTIECLEKTRYLSGVRNRVERNRLEHAKDHQRFNSDDIAERVKRAGEQILEFHANAVPGASRYEEGEEHTSPTPAHRPPVNYTDFPSSDADTPAQQALRRAHQQQHPPPKPPSSYDFERDREANRYAEYLDDRDSEKLPNAFDLGWKRNLKAVFGLSPWLWLLPVMNSPGNGWNWETSDKWMRAKQELETKQQQEAERAYAHRSQPQRLRGGYDGSYNGHVDEGDRAMSMDTLNSRGRGRDRTWGGRFRKDIDRSGADGEEEGFEVSSDDEDDRTRDRFQASAWGES